jgi:hypothetical protein
MITRMLHTTRIKNEKKLHYDDDGNTRVRVAYAYRDEHIYSCWVRQSVRRLTSRCKTRRRHILMVCYIYAICATTPSPAHPTFTNTRIKPMQHNNKNVVSNTTLSSTRRRHRYNTTRDDVVVATNRHDHMVAHLTTPLL